MPDRSIWVCPSRYRRLSTASVARLLATYLVLSEGCELPLADASIDLVISFELIEHLHRDDAVDHVREVYRVLKPGGSYVCGTPNIVCGPHDCGNVSPLLPCPVQH